MSGKPDSDKTRDEKTQDTASSQRPLTPQARRALAEAEQRRRERSARGASQACANEIGGRDGPDPARYGDWEKGGIASDF
ncbi:MAG TPA: DUF1674 domain-containing protein [Hyphomicrobium sp.]|nr:DUF1674 domain-containing protein [Hyphomicrobium sp.]